MNEMLFKIAMTIMMVGTIFGAITLVLTMWAQKP